MVMQCKCKGTYADFILSNCCVQSIVSVRACVCFYGFMYRPEIKCIHSFISLYRKLSDQVAFSN